MARDTRFTIYVSEEEKRQLEQEADERDMTASSYGAHLLDRGRMAEAEESMTSRTDAEAAIERVVQETLAQYHDDLLAAVEKSSVYSIANFELLAGTDGFDVSGARRNDLFSTGRRRTHTPLSNHDETMAADSTTENDTEPESESSGSDSESQSGSSLVDELSRDVNSNS